VAKVKCFGFTNNLMEKPAVPQCCEDYQRFGIAESAWYEIDPDGHGIGQPPFRVFCNFSAIEGKFKTGIAYYIYKHIILVLTEVGHNVQRPTEIQSCQEEYCHSVEVTYEATSLQIQGLIAISDSCKQEINVRSNTHNFSRNSSIV